MVGSKRYINFIVTLGVLLFLSACAQQINTQVTRFNQMPLVEGQRFIFATTKEQKGSLEYKQYAELIAQKLQSYGFEQANNPSKASFIVAFNYGIDKGKTSTTEMPLYGQTGGGYSNYTSNTMGSIGTTPYSGMTTGTVYTAPTYGQVGSIPVTTTVFTRVLYVSIYDAKASKKDNPVKVFEAKAVSMGRSSALAMVMPNMINSVFKNFPGKNGESYSDVTPKVDTERK